MIIKSTKNLTKSIFNWRKVMQKVFSATKNHKWKKNVAKSKCKVFNVKSGEKRKQKMVQIKSHTICQTFDSLLDEFLVIGDMFINYKHESACETRYRALLDYAKQEEEWLKVLGDGVVNKTHKVTIKFLQKLLWKGKRDKTNAFVFTFCNVRVSRGR